MQQVTQLLAIPGFAIYLVSLVVLGGLAVLEIVRGNGGRAFAWTVAVVLAALSFRFGEDFLHHLYRIVVLADQVRSGTPSLLVTNTVHHETLPLFVYYSFVPYLPAVALNLAGLPAQWALRLTMGLALVILALGLARLVRFDRRSENTYAAFLAAILFLAANYVHNLWIGRQAFAEIWVYCLIPWVTLAVLRPGRIVPLAALLFLQITGHPLVFAQAFGCSLLIAWALSKEPPATILARYAGATALALVLATPFWLPQALWQTLIQGPAVLARFADSFLSLGEIFGWVQVRGLGYALPIVLVLMIVFARGRLPRRVWMLLAAIVALVAIQTPPLLPLAERLPLLPTSLFIWRLMLPAALLAFVVLLIGWRSERRRNVILAGLTALSVVTLALALGVRAPRSLQQFATFSEAEWIQLYRVDNQWGQREFQPNYAALPRQCGEAQKVLFTDLLQGIRATAAYIAVPAATLGGVDYTVDGKPAALSACDGNLVIGPVTPGTEVRGSTSTLTLILWARLAALAICVIAWLAWAARNQQAVRPQAA